MKTELVKVTIKASGKTLELTPDEGRELVAQLEKLFPQPKPVQTVYIDRWHQAPYRQYFGDTFYHLGSAGGSISSIGVALGNTCGSLSLNDR